MLSYHPKGINIGDRFPSLSHLIW